MCNTFLTILESTRQSDRFKDGQKVNARVVEMDVHIDVLCVVVVSVLRYVRPLSSFLSAFMMQFVIDGSVLSFGARALTGLEHRFRDL